MPSWLARRFDGLEDDPATSHLVAAAVATEQAMDLVDEGVKKFHFYTPSTALILCTPSATCWVCVRTRACCCELAKARAAG